MALRCLLMVPLVGVSLASASPCWICGTEASLKNATTAGQDNGRSYTCREAQDFLNTPPELRDKAKDLTCEVGISLWRYTCCLGAKEPVISLLWRLASEAFVKYQFLLIIGLSVLLCIDGCRTSEAGRSPVFTANAVATEQELTTLDSYLESALVEDSRPRLTSEELRLPYLDNLKTFLTATVIIHHVGCMHTDKDFFYTHVGQAGTRFGSMMIEKMLGLNQAYFMTLFFFVSGYFTPPSFDRKGRWNFIVDRQRRLGVPFLVWFFVGNPALMTILLLHVGKPWHYIPGLGPPWFVAWLLVLSVVYAVIPGKPCKLNLQICSNLSPWTMLACLTVLGASLGALEACLHYNIVRCEGFNVPVACQAIVWYPFAYAFGIACQRNDWLSNFARGRTTLFAWVLLVVVTVSLHFVVPPSGTAILNGILCISMSACELKLFYWFFNNQGSCSRCASGGAYAVYLVHPLIVLPTVLCVSNLLDGSGQGLDGILAATCFSISSVISISLCWLAAMLLVRLPGFSSVLYEC